MKIAEAWVPFSPSTVTAERERAVAASAAVREQVVVLYDQHRQPLFRYLRSLGLGDADCEEVIQEVFLGLFRHLLAGKPQGSLQAWLFTVARNTARKRQARRGEERELEWAAEACDGAPNPEEFVFKAQRKKRIAAVVKALPEQDRECLVLRCEGLGYREIAAMQGRSLGAIAGAVKRALGKIAEAADR